MIKTRSRSAASKDDIKSVDAPSAIPGVTVPEVRRGLDALRTAWNNPSPFYLSAPLSLEGGVQRKKVKSTPSLEEVDDTMESFCIKYVMGHHVKRCGKSKHAA
jgi:hypothetical protein